MSYFQSQLLFSESASFELSEKYDVSWRKKSLLSCFSKESTGCFSLLRVHSLFLDFSLIRFFFNSRRTATWQFIFNIIVFKSCNNIIAMSLRCKKNIFVRIAAAGQQKNKGILNYRQCPFFRDILTPGDLSFHLICIFNISLQRAHQDKPFDMSFVNVRRLGQKLWSIIFPQPLKCATPECPQSTYNKTL